MEKIKPLTIEIERDIWERFKESVPRTITLNEKIVELIEKELNDEQR